MLLAFHRNQHSCDSKLLLVQCGAPDWTVLVWRWYSAKVTVAMSLGVTDITRCEFNPWDDTVVAACSNSSARLLRLDLHANSGRVNHVADTVCDSPGHSYRVC